MLDAAAVTVRSALLLLTLVAVAAAAPADRPPRVMLELLPLQLVRGQPHYLRPANASSWLVACRRAEHPNRQVAAALAKRGQRPRVVHSSSWRYSDGALIVTYFAVLPSSARPPAGLQRRAVTRRTVARGTALEAPKQLAVAAVVAHALRHLAWLSADDLAVRRGLPAGWVKALRAFKPKPFLQLR